MKPQREETVIVIDRHGTSAELTGWRRWLAVAGSYLIVALAALIAVALLVGLAMTAAMVFVVAIPLAIVLVVIAYVTSSRAQSGRSGS